MAEGDGFENREAVLPRVGSNPTSSSDWSIGAVVYLASLSRRRSWVQIPHGPFMAELVKGLTHWFVDPACVGSNPTFRPIMED